MVAYPIVLDDERVCLLITHTSIRRILETTVNLLDDVAKILRRALHCDDFRMLPETASLWPLFQLLIRFPGLMPKAEDALSSIALRLILADMKKSELLNLSTQVNSVQRTKAALALFDDHKRLTSPAIQRAIQDGIKRAQSLTGRYALVLYWLLRRQGARDFLYNANVPDKAEELRSKYGSEQLELCERVEPEKQHIVPYDRLKDVFNLQGKARPGRHAVHDIGNLTYISASLNSFETGVGSRPLRLSDEPQKNLYAHMLMDSGLLSLYEDACRYADTRDPRFDRRMARARYGKFCSRRREAIKERLIKWERELRNASRLHDAEDLDLLPAERLINPQIDDKIRRLNYPPSVTESVIKLCDRKRMGKSRKTGVDLSIAYQKKSASGGVQQVLRVDLHEGGRALELKLADDTFRAKFRRRYPEIQLGTGKKSLCRLKTESEEAAQVAEMVDWIASQLPQSGEDDA